MISSSRIYLCIWTLLLCGLALHLPTIREVSGDQSIQEKLDEHLGAIKHQFERQARQHHHYVEVGVDNFGSVPCSEPTDNDSVFNYSIPYLNESLGQINFNDYRGKVILLVNVATFCESTIEYPMYNDLIRKYGDKIQLVGFPCNQFWNQEPSSSAEEIYNAIKYVRPGNGFEPLFPLTKRIDVNGENQHAIYSFLKRSCPATRLGFKTEKYLLYAPKSSRDVRWNFEKFLIHPSTGFVYKRYDQKFLPNRLTDDIDLLLADLAASKSRN